LTKQIRAIETLCFLSYRRDFWHFSHFLKKNATKKMANKNATNARMKNGLDFIHGGGCEELVSVDSSLWH
jgi:hypothetical protein